MPAPKPTRAKVSKHESFTRQLSDSCMMCQMNQFHCTQCKRNCHKKCSGHNTINNANLKNSRSRSYQKIHTGDEHWKKVLQTNNENNCDLLVCRKHCVGNPLTSPWSDREVYSSDYWADKVKHNSNNKCDIKYFDYVNTHDSLHSTPHDNLHSNSSSVSRTSSYASHIRSKSPSSNSTCQQNSQNLPPNLISRQPSVSSPQKEKNVFHTLVTRFVNWIGPNKNDSLAKMDNKAPPHHCSTDLSSQKSDVSPTSNRFFHDSHKLEQKRTKRRQKAMTLSMPRKTTAMSTSESEMERRSPISNRIHSTTQLSFANKHFASNNHTFNPHCNKVKHRGDSPGSYNFLTTSSISPNSREPYHFSKNGYLSPTINIDINKHPFDSQSNSKLPFGSFNKASSDYEHGCRGKGFNSTSTMSTSNASSSSSLHSLSSQKSAEPSSIESQEIQEQQTRFKSAQDKRDKYKSKRTTSNSLLSKNSVGLSKDTLINSSVEKDSVDISDNISMCSLLENCSMYLKETLQDCDIPFNDIKVKEVVKRSSVYTIYKGQWHGEVLVYFYNSLTESRIPKFLQELRRLSRIRHQYIHLFMGASVNTANIAIVMSELKGTSVYERIHTVSERLPTRTKVNIARHVAQAIGYLHAKGFPVKTINSRNVYYDTKVKLSLLDQSLPCINYHTKSDVVYLSRGALSYLAPELLKEIRPTKVAQDNDNSPAFNDLPCHGRYASLCSYGGAFDSWLDDGLFNFKSDTYAFGTFLYEILSYQRPLKTLSNDEFIWQTCNGVRQKVNHLTCSNILKGLIERCWSHNPEDRPSFIEINHELDAKTGLHKRHSSSQPEKLDRQPSVPLRPRSRLM